MKEPKPGISKELRQEMEVATRKFDRAARRHLCLRCGARGVTHRIRNQARTPVGVLPPFTYWLCAACGAEFSRWVSEIRDAKREAERPRLEAERAEQKRVLEQQLADKREALDRERAAQGLPPFAKPAAPKKPTARRKAPPPGTPPA